MLITANRKMHMSCKKRSHILFSMNYSSCGVFGVFQALQFWETTEWKKNNQKKKKEICIDVTWIGTSDAILIWIYVFTLYLYKIRIWKKLMESRKCSLPSEWFFFFSYLSGKMQFENASKGPDGKVFQFAMSIVGLQNEFFLFF